MININKLCKSNTPKYYKSVKKTRGTNPVIEDAIKCWLYDNFLNKYHIIDTKHLPYPSESLNLKANKEYREKVELTCENLGKKVLSRDDYNKVKIKQSGILKSNILLQKILNNGNPINIKSKYDVNLNKIAKASSKKKNVIDIELNIDYLRIQKNKDDINDNAFCIQTLFGKNINLQNIVFNIEKEGIDILMAATKDIVKLEYPKTNWKFWVLVIDLDENTSMLVELNENNVEIAKETLFKRIKTLKSCVELKTYFHYDALYSSDGSGIIKLPISKRTIDLRQKNNFW